MDAASQTTNPQPNKETTAVDTTYKTQTVGPVEVFYREAGRPTRP